MVVQVDVFGPDGAGRPRVQQRAVLAVHLHPVHRIGAHHAHPVAPAIIEIGRLAGGALHPVALVEHVGLRPALGDVALAVVGVAEVEGGRSAAGAVDAVRRRVDGVRQRARRATGRERAGDQVVERVVTVGGAAPHIGRAHRRQAVQVVVAHGPRAGVRRQQVRDAGHIGVRIEAVLVVEHAPFGHRVRQPAHVLRQAVRDAVAVLALPRLLWQV